MDINVKLAANNDNRAGVEVMKFEVGIQTRFVAFGTIETVVIAG